MVIGVVADWKGVECKGVECRSSVSECMNTNQEGRNCIKACPGIAISSIGTSVLI